MAESPIITSIISGSPPRSPERFELPRAVERALYEQQRRVEAARAIILLAEEKVCDTVGSMPIKDCDQLSALLDGVAELLRPVNNLTDETALMQRGKQILGESGNG